MWRRLTSPFREFGIVAGTLYLLNRVLRMLSPDCGVFVYDLMAQPITGRPMLPANLAKNLRFAEIERGDPQIDSMPAREDIKAARFEQGATCLGAYRKDELLGYVWFCTKRYEEDEVRCTYELADVDRSVFDFDLVVLPKHRMGIGFTAIWHGANSYLRKRGIHYTYSRLTRFNVVSRRAHDHLQWRRVGQALFLKMWVVEMMLSTLRPYAAVTWRPGQRIALQLRSDASNPPVAASVDDESRRVVSGKESSP
jgi:hypothetical protein